MSDDITITFSESEFQILVNLLDVAVRAGGLRTAKEALPITARMEAAYDRARGGVPIPSTAPKSAGPGN